LSSGLLQHTNHIESILAIRNAALARFDCRDEVFQFQLKWLGSALKNFFFPFVNILKIGINRLLVKGDGLGKLIVDQHSATTDNDEASLNLRPQPGIVEIRLGTASELHLEMNVIRDAFVWL
jgi:hypothetical protein